ncbi:hypothetical protein EGW08_023144 [Elysia chlorotica]|uniref:Uncharacterized protein n=1 Tax=Elysia chlorotica TaxID=188477 RepID=A0A3S1BK58_ELYCH|nr:hypothetical protein EGW08_023144 [Elysia chlorotica]
MVPLGLIVALSLIAVAAPHSVAKREVQPEGYQETIIFLKKQTDFGQSVFIRGGVGNGTNCAPNESPKDDPCAIPITHIELDISAETTIRDEWAESDLYLTWGESRDEQDSVMDGTPAQWTSWDESNNDYFHPLNTYGDDYWIVHFEMNCSMLENGFFDFKGFLDGQWETDISQSDCAGNGAETPSYTSINHIARCGYINVFEWGNPDCTINAF